MIGGDAFFQAGAVDLKHDQGLRSTDFANRFRLNITPTATADNGLEYGARLRIRANNPDNSVDNDRAYLFANGGFGTLQAGTINGLSDEYGIIGPNVEGVAGGPDNGTLNFTAGTTLGKLLPNMTTNFRAYASGDIGSKVIYLTPSFSGLKAGIAYTPQLGDSGNSVLLGKNAATFHDVVEVGANYAGEFSGVSLEASAYYQTGQAASSVEDLSSFHVGTNIGYAGFKIGGSYAYAGNSGYAKSTPNKKKQGVWIVGGQYTTGPVTLAIDYLHAAGNNGADFDSTYTAGTVPAKADLYQAGVTYTIASGLTTGLEYSYVKLNTDLPASANGGVNADDHAHIIMLDTRLAF